MPRPVAAIAVLVGVAIAVLVPTAASAHVVPSTVIALDVRESEITGTVTVPAADLTLASGIPVGETVDADAVADYLEEHTSVATGGAAWQVDVTDAEVAQVEQWGAGAFPAVIAEITLTPPTPGQLRTFTLDYDAVVHEVITADVFVILHSDWAVGEWESSRDLGTIGVDTASGEVPPLQVDLDDGSGWQGFVGMVALGSQHIAEGVDHQLFLLTLLLPAPLLAVGRRWARAAPPRTAVRRILTVTIAFTIGHSLTLILGTLGLPVPTQAVEILIAVSILVAALHAIRPIFPGREAVVAGGFGLIHGLAFSTTLSALDLTGWRLALSLLGFNVGIELMQLVVVMLVLPPLIVLARTAAYTPLRVTAAAVTGAAAVGWVLERIGVLSGFSDAVSTVSVAGPWIVGALWAAALVALARRRGGEAPVLAEEEASDLASAAAGERPDA